jgi:hypothetical protein
MTSDNESDFAQALHAATGILTILINCDPGQFKLVWQILDLQNRPLSST